MTADFLLTEELNVGWLLALVRDHPDGLAKSVPLIFKVILKICNQLAYLIFSRQDGNPLKPFAVVISTPVLSLQQLASLG